MSRFIENEVEDLLPENKPLRRVKTIRRKKKAPPAPIFVPQEEVVEQAAPEPEPQPEPEPEIEEVETSSDCEWPLSCASWQCLFSLSLPNACS